MPHRPRLRFSSSLLWLLASGLWALASVAAIAQPFVAGQTYLGRRGYIEYRAGDLPLILTSGHGGDLTPAEIPNRTYGTLVTDTNTRELAIACYDDIVARTGHYPHLIISHLNRIKLDPNREIVEGAQGDPEAEQAWNEFHDFIAAARDSARALHGFGHVIDLHGHGHDIDRLELGYALGADELNQTNTVLNNPGYAWMSTLRTLLLAHPGTSFPDLLRGPRSLGDLFNDRGVPAWPSSAYPSPGTENFFDGGHIVRTHSCILDNDTVHGVQIETHYTGVRNNAAARADFAANFSRVMQPWLYDNYGYSLGTLSLYTLRAPASAVLTRGGPSLTLTVDRGGNTGFSSTLALAFGGIAILGSDYTASLSSLAFASGQTTATVTITPAALGSASGDRTLTVALAPNLKQSAVLAPLTLTLGDGASQTVRVTALAHSVLESDHIARFRLTRTHSADALDVPLAWSGTALPEADYYDAPATAVFPVGGASVEVAVPLVDDGRAAPDKTLALALGASAAFTIGHPASASVSLIDDDRPAGLAVWLRGDLAGNVAPDSSGHARHATTLPATGSLATGPVQLVVPSAGGAPAINFDSVNDTVALPKFSLDPAGAFTLAFFFRLDAAGAIGDQNLAAYGTRSTAGSLHLYLATTNAANGTVSLRTNLPGLATNALDVARTSPDTWQDSAWRHYALSVGADGVARVYIDGVLRHTASGRTGALATDELLWLGWRPFSGAATGFMDGAMRDVRVYQRALPAAEIVSLSSSRLGFEAWLSSSDLPTATAEADPDADGLSLFLEYALGASPAVPAPAPRHRAGLSAGRLTLAFLREASASDLLWTIEACDSLGDTWQPLARRAAADSAWTILSAGASVVENNDHVIFTDGEPLATHPMRFLRVHVARLP